MFSGKTIRQAALILLLTIPTAGCESTRYYAQAIQGQMALIADRKPIGRILSQPHIPLRLKDRLKSIREILHFARTELHLPVGGNYQDYVELGRENVVWTISAAPEFSLTPKTWCFPLAGCLSYRSYFEEQNAYRYAEDLKKEGFDVYVRGVAAYSTLGWFDDPVLSSFVYYTDADLAALIFHELVPGFFRLLQSVGGDLKRFYEISKDLALEKKVERYRRLENLTKAD